MTEKTANPPIIDTTGRFKTKWWKGIETNTEYYSRKPAEKIKHHTKNTATVENKLQILKNQENQQKNKKHSLDYRIKGKIPQNTENLLIHIHGWRNNQKSGEKRIKQINQLFKQQGYEGTILGLNWDSNCIWWNAKKLAKENAKILTKYIKKHKKQNPQTRIHLQGHSLGTKIVLETIKNLQTNKNQIQTAILLGGAVPQKQNQLKGKYGKTIQKTTKKTENYYTPHDKVLKLLSYYEKNKLIGQQKTPQPRPKNLTNHNTKLKKHKNYYTPPIAKKITQKITTP